MKIVAVIQARISSTRLPGKVLKKISGKPMLWYVYKRLCQSKLIDQIIISTSTHKSDNRIAQFCEKYNIGYFRGSLNNVLKRFYDTTYKFSADIIIRITADCPLIDPGLIDEGIKIFIKEKPDYLTNIFHRTYPRGFDYEIINFATLEKTYHNAKSPVDLEHVTPYIYNSHPEDFKIINMLQKQDKSGYQVTVDNPEDFRLIRILINKYKADKLDYKQITWILETNPELVKINQHVIRKHLSNSN